MTWWLIGAALFGVAAFGLWRAVQSPAFVAGITAMAARAVANAIVPKIGKRMSAEGEAEWRREERAGRGDEWLRRRAQRRGK